MDSTYQFWRPSLLSVLIGVAVIVICWVYQQTAPVDPIRQSGVLSNLKLPTPSLSPEEVVNIQVDALRASSQGFGALQCYCFAAPANRLVTGPIERFTRMVRKPPFDLIGKAATCSVGTADIRGDLARSTVAVVGEDHQLRVFSWLLRKQQEAPYESCWLTVGVFLLHDSAQPVPSPSDGEIEA